VVDLVSKAIDAVFSDQTFVGKILSPFSEGAGFISDKIRYYRWKQAIETLEKANDFAEEKGLSQGSVPENILFPWLEGASLQPTKNDAIRDLWAKLLVASSQTEDVSDLVYIDVLRKIGNSEAKLLNWFWENKGLSYFDDPDYHRYIVESAISEVDRYCKIISDEYIIVDIFKENNEQFQHAVSLFSLSGPFLPIEITIAADACGSAVTEPVDHLITSIDNVSFEALRYLNLIGTQSAEKFRLAGRGHYIDEHMISMNVDYRHWEVEVAYPSRFCANIIERLNGI
jgi:hypothetical protein